MDFPFSLFEIVPDRISVLKDGKFSFCKGIRECLSHDIRVKNLSQVIDTLGDASAKAQGLKAPITSAQKFKTCQHTLYIMKDKGEKEKTEVIVGILKIGKKRLFLADSKGALHEVEPLCVLDFYVHESRQRCGFGKQLFEYMLTAEEKCPHELAIDRPSPKFLSFLRKHYSLCSYPKQANNFVVFDQFFSTFKESKHSRRTSSPLQTSQSIPQPKAAVYTFPSSQQMTSLAQVVDRRDCARVPVRSKSGRRIAQDYSQTQTKYHQFQRHGEAAKQTSLSSKENTCSPTGANWTVEGVLNQMGGAKSTMPYLGLRQFNRHYVPVTSGDSWQHFSKYQAQQGHQRGSVFHKRVSNTNNSRFHPSSNFYF